MPRPPKTYRPRTPDRTVILLVPGCIFLASSIVSALLAFYSFPAGARRVARGTEGVFGEMLASLATTLGPAGTGALIAVMELSVGAWFLAALARYVEKVRADRRAIGLS